ncbi:hypothetical protein Y032_0631g865 [Ancylostoma ceylanicum]|uniref:Uncharacterized protein n=1 Tax=Ancylostoma ceylanicum TaxID=53326 RepID=A0A016WKC4_9BILA|nr:hypothetical protein Y032_0631g865 [Ancylostoma ceylanicum]
MKHFVLADVSTSRCFQRPESGSRLFHQIPPLRVPSIRVDHTLTSLRDSKPEFVMFDSFFSCSIKDFEVGKIDRNTAIFLWNIVITHLISWKLSKLGPALGSEF